MTAGRLPARATDGFTGLAEAPFPFGGGTLAVDEFGCKAELKAGARKDRSDSTVAEVHDVGEATARWIFAARAGNSLRVMVKLGLCILGSSSTD